MVDFIDSFNDKAVIELFKSLGEDVVITPDVGEPFTVRGIFQDGELDIQAAGGAVDIEVKNPRFTCRIQDILGYNKNWQLTFKGKDYKFSEILEEDRVTALVQLRNI